jgi:PHD/YefM family antitoxin component YafN of YafNO toxin-antitoxin module
MNEPQVSNPEDPIAVAENRQALVHISAETHALVETELADEPDEVKDAVKHLIEAIKRRAQVEAKVAGEMTRETYLAAVKKARQLIEEKQLKPPFGKEIPVEEYRDRLEKSIELIENEAKKNWDSVTKEAKHFGDKLADAAKAAWEVLKAPRT